MPKGRKKNKSKGDIKVIGNLKETVFIQEEKLIRSLLHRDISYRKKMIMEVVKSKSNKKELFEEKDRTGEGRKTADEISHENR